MPKVSDDLPEGERGGGVNTVGQLEKMCTFDTFTSRTTKEEGGRGATSSDREL